MKAVLVKKCSFGIENSLLIKSIIEFSVLPQIRHDQKLITVEKCLLCEADAPIVSERIT